MKWIVIAAVLLLAATAPAENWIEYDTDSLCVMGDATSVTIAGTGVIDNVWYWDDVVGTIDTMCSYSDGPRYFHHLDSHLVRARIECDTLFDKVEYTDGDSTLTGWQITKLECDTIYRFEYDSVWANKQQVWLDSTMYKALMKLIEEE